MHKSQCVQGYWVHSFTANVLSTQGEHWLGLDTIHLLTQSGYNPKGVGLRVEWIWETSKESSNMQITASLWC